MDSSGNRSSCNGNNDSRDSKAFEEIKDNLRESSKINTSNNISESKNKKLAEVVSNNSGIANIGEDYKNEK